MNWYFKIHDTSDGQPTWWLYSGNHKLVAWAGETFSSTFSARRAAASFKAGSATARYEVFLDAGGHYRWRAWRGSDKVAASGESFSSRSSADVAAENVRINAGGAQL